MIRRTLPCALLLALSACGKVEEHPEEEALTEEERIAHNAPDANGKCPDVTFDEGAPGGLLWQREFTSEGMFAGDVDASIDPCGNYYVGWIGSDDGLVRLLPDGTEDWRWRTEDFEDVVNLYSLLAAPDGRLLVSAGAGLHVFQPDGSPHERSYQSWHLQGLRLTGMVHENGRYLGWSDGVTEFSPDGEVWVPIREGRWSFSGSDTYGRVDARYLNDGSGDVLLAYRWTRPTDYTDYTRVDGEPFEPKPVTHKAIVELFQGGEWHAFWESPESELFPQNLRFVQGNARALGYSLSDSVHNSNAYVSALDDSWEWEGPDRSLLVGAASLQSGDMLLLLTTFGEGYNAGPERHSITRLSPLGAVLATTSLTDEWGVPLFSEGGALRLSADERRLLIAAPLDGGGKVWVGVLDVESLR